jgi:hypothetical protein
MLKPLGTSDQASVSGVPEEQELSRFLVNDPNLGHSRRLVASHARECGDQAHATHAQRHIMASTAGLDVSKLSGHSLRAGKDLGRFPA